MTFVPPALSGPNVYLIHRHYLTLNVRMVMKNGTAIPNIPATSEEEGDRIPQIGPVNNILHSLFDQVTCDFNNSVLNSASKYYPWKAYLTSLLSYNTEAKSTWMNEHGW